MPKDLHDHTKVDALSNHIRRCRVAEVVKPLAWEAEGREQYLKPMSQTVAGHRHAGLSAKKQVPRIALPS